MRKDIEKKLNQLKHPEINQSLWQLGMIGEIKNKKEKWIIELKIPFPHVPIKQLLINSIQETLSDYIIEVKISVMNEKEKERFLVLARENWAL